MKEGVSGKITVIGIGPGALEMMTSAARNSIEEAQILLGYRTYLDLIREICTNIPREASGMGQEILRARRSIELAKSGLKVAVISDGDAGIYGMAGLILEMLEGNGENGGEGEIIPGITALNAAAALLGAPLMSDFAAVSLSNYLISDDTIFTRVECAARAGFVICLYNPSSHKRRELFNEICNRLYNILPSQTPVGIVRNAFRPNQTKDVISLGCLVDADVDMRTIVLIGNAQTYTWQGKMITRRGYQNKYNIASEIENEQAEI